MADMLRKKICNAVQSECQFSPLADKSEEISQTEQLTMLLRCVDISHSSIHDYLLTLVPGISFSAESLSFYTLNYFGEYTQSPRKILSQGNDVAVVMSVRYSGAHK